MSILSTHRITSKGSSSRIFQVAIRATLHAAASWSNPVTTSGAPEEPTHRRAAVTTRTRRSPPLCVYCVANCMKSGWPSRETSGWLGHTSKRNISVLRWSSVLSFHTFVPLSPTTLSLTLL